MIATRGEIYAAVDKARTGRGTTMMRSVDNGATWTAADEGLSGHSIRGLPVNREPFTRRASLAFTGGNRPADGNISASARS